MQCDDYRSVKGWDGRLPRRRIARFADVLRGPYLVMIYDHYVDTAASWDGFIQWVGGEKPAETRHACWLCGKRFKADCPKEEMPRSNAGW